MDPATGEEKDSAIQMMPAPYGKAYGLNLLNNIVYTASGQACHGVPNELYAVDLTTKKAFNSTPPQGGIFGTAGPRSAAMEPSISNPEMGPTMSRQASCRLRWRLTAPPAIA